MLRHKLEDMAGVSNAAAQTQAGGAAELELDEGTQASQNDNKSEERTGAGIGEICQLGDRNPSICCVCELNSGT